MRTFGLILAWQVIGAGFALAAGAETPQLSVWHVLLGVMPLVLVGGFFYGIYKVVVAARRNGHESRAGFHSESHLDGFVPEGRTEKFCPECGSSIRVRAEICPKCGVRQPAMYSSEPTAFHGRNKLVAALFALILGGLGMHKFYLGRIGQGVLYLLFCWTVIPALIGLVEGIVYLTMSEGEFAKRYGTA